MSRLSRLQDQKLQNCIVILYVRMQYVFMPMPAMPMMPAPRPRPDAETPRQERVLINCHHWQRHIIIEIQYCKRLQTTRVAPAHCISIKE